MRAPPGWHSRTKAIASALALAAILGGCSFLPARTLPSVPPPSAAAAQLPGYVGIRTYGDTLGEPGDSGTLIGPTALARLSSGKPLNLLALSGGGDGGAFGAGVLKGWTQRRDRPEFDYVTGVSTGALIAPLAFLGSDFDGALERFYTKTRVHDVVLLHPLRVLTGAPSIGDSSPLRDRIHDIITPAMVDTIAAERRKGRLLLIGTTNLDAQRQVIWDIGRIAASGQSDRVDLIRKILLASSSVPGALPPVAIDVVADGRRYQEVHVDGGVTQGVFAYPPDVTLPPPAGPRRMWVIRNSKLGPEPQTTGPTALAIASRSLTTLIKGQSLANISAIRAQADRDGFEFNVTAVPPNLPLVDTLPFDEHYMVTVFRAGEATGRSPNGWASDIGPLLGTLPQTER